VRTFAKADAKASSGGCAGDVMTALGYGLDVRWVGSGACIDVSGPCDCTFDCVDDQGAVVHQQASTFFNSDYHCSTFASALCYALGYSRSNVQCAPSASTECQCVGTCDMTQFGPVPETSYLTCLNRARTECDDPLYPPIFQCDPIP
jgi:hypothetical protein